MQSSAETALTRRWNNPPTTATTSDNAGKVPPCEGSGAPAAPAGCRLRERPHRGGVIVRLWVSRSLA